MFAGTINESGSSSTRVVTALANNSTLARIIHAVEAAQDSRAPTPAFCRWFAAGTPRCIRRCHRRRVVAAAVHGCGMARLDHRALVLLVVACPCALVISPVSIVSGLAAATRHGILIKGGVYLEEGRKLRWLALDKTGTITHGKPAQTDFVTWGNALASDSRSIAASLAARSGPSGIQGGGTRPRRRTGLPARRGRIRKTPLPGRGVQAKSTVRPTIWGNHRMLEELGQCTPELEQRIAALETAGKTVVMLVRRKGGTCLIRRSGHHQGQQQDRHRRAARTGHQHHDADRRQPQYGTGHCRTKPESTVKATYSQMTNCAKWSNWPEAARLAWSVMASTMHRPWQRADIGFAMGAAGTDTAAKSRPPMWP